jgi:hypothetical protein
MLEERLKQLEDAFNTNTSAFSDGFKMVEAQLEVLRRVVEHVRTSSPFLKLVDVNSGGFLKQVSWNAYLKEYIEELVAKETTQEEHGPGPILLDSDAGQEQPTIFGGGQ